MSQTTPGGPQRHVLVPAKFSVIAVPSPSTGPSSSGTQAGALSTRTQPNKDASFRQLELKERNEEEAEYAEVEKEQPEVVTHYSRQSAVWASRPPRVTTLKEKKILSRGSTA